MSTYFKDEHKRYLNILKNNDKGNSSSLNLDSDYSLKISSILTSLKNYEKGLNQMNEFLTPSMEKKSKILRDNIRILSDTYSMLYDSLFPKLLEIESLDKEYEEGRKVYKKLNTGSIIDSLDEISKNNLEKKTKLKSLSEEIDNILISINKKEDGIRLFNMQLLNGDNTSSNTTTDPKTISSNTVIWNTLGENFKVASTAISAEEYAKLVRQNGVYQDSNSAIYGDSCLAFSYIHASNLANGQTTDRAKDALSYVHAGEFTDYRSSDKNEVLTKIYDEINEGKPVILQVNGNTNGTVRHFVTVVGYKESVTSANNLTEKDLLILDSWDGQIERMDTTTSRFMTTGEQTGHSYKGYWLRVLK